MAYSSSAVYYRAANLPPFRPDLLVFGDHEASEPPRGLQPPLRQCRVHEVTWRGDAPCWECADEAARAIDSISSTIDIRGPANGA
jgi:hypothetical protein